MGQKTLTIPTPKPNFQLISVYQAIPNLPISNHVLKPTHLYHSYLMKWKIRMPSKKTSLTLHQQQKKSSWIWVLITRTQLIKLISRWRVVATMKFSLSILRKVKLLLSFWEPSNNTIRCSRKLSLNYPSKLNPPMITKITKIWLWNKFWKINHSFQFHFRAKDNLSMCLCWKCWLKRLRNKIN